LPFIKIWHENAIDETKVTQRQLDTIAIIGPLTKNKGKGKYTLYHLCEKYNDGSRDIPIFYFNIYFFILFFKVKMFILLTYYIYTSI